MMMLFTLDWLAIIILGTHSFLPVVVGPFLLFHGFVTVERAIFLAIRRSVMLVMLVMMMIIAVDPIRLYRLLGLSFNTTILGKCGLFFGALAILPTALTRLHLTPVGVQRNRTVTPACQCSDRYTGGSSAISFDVRIGHVSRMRY
jgi:hypothetical protein